SVPNRVSTAPSAGLTTLLSTSTDAYSGPSTGSLSNRVRAPVQAAASVGRAANPSYANAIAGSNNDASDHVPSSRAACSSSAGAPGTVADAPPKYGTDARGVPSRPRGVAPAPSSATGTSVPAARVSRNASPPGPQWCGSTTNNTNAAAT